MIGLLMLQASLGAIGPQALPPAGCAAFLWSRSDAPQLVAMAGTEPGVLRVRLDGRTLTLPRTGADGDAGRGFPTTARYAAGPVNATVELRLTNRPDLTDGALVSDATVTIEQAGRDTIVAPLGGMVGCAPTQATSRRN